LPVWTLTRPWRLTHAMSAGRAGSACAPGPARTFCGDAAGGGPAAWAALGGGPLGPSDVGERLSFHPARSLALPRSRQRGLASPPAPAIAGTDMAPHLPGHAARRIRPTQQEGGEAPVRQRPLAPMPEGFGAVVAGTRAAVTPGAVAPGAVWGRAPAAHVVALTARTVQRTGFPPGAYGCQLGTVRH